MADNGHAEVRAAGAVLWRPGRHGLEVALVHRPRYDDWSFPKGKQAAGEHVLLTAVREVSEETGMRPALGRRLATTRYMAQGRSKQVDYWAARPAGPAGDGPAPDGPADGFVPNAEVDDLEWLPLAAARDRLSYDHDRPVLDGFAAGPAETAPLILLRHAFAVSKDDWGPARSEEHTSELQSQFHLVCRLLLEKKKKIFYSLIFLNKQITKHIMG